MRVRTKPEVRARQNARKREANLTSRLVAIWDALKKAHGFELTDADVLVAFVRGSHSISGTMLGREWRIEAVKDQFFSLSEKRSRAAFREIKVTVSEKRRNGISRLFTFRLPLQNAASVLVAATPTLASVKTSVERREHFTNSAKAA